MAAGLDRFILPVRFIIYIVERDSACEKDSLPLRPSGIHQHVPRGEHDDRFGNTHLPKHVGIHYPEIARAQPPGIVGFPPHGAHLWAQARLRMVTRLMSFAAVLARPSRFMEDFTAEGFNGFIFRLRTCLVPAGTHSPDLRK